MEVTELSDGACEKVISGCLSAAESDLLPVRWFLEDVRSLYLEPVTAAAAALHPSATGSRPTAPCLNDDPSRRCKPPRSWWSGETC
jgi:hypothetical protein